MRKAKYPVYNSWVPYKDILENFETIKDTKPPSDLEERFMQVWLLIYNKEDKKLKLNAEYRFYEERRWRADFANLKAKTLIEIEGGLFRGRHTNPLGYASDCEKYNAATLLGWRKFSLVNVPASGLNLLGEGYIQYIYDFCKNEQSD